MANWEKYIFQFMAQGLWVVLLAVLGDVGLRAGKSIAFRHGVIWTNRYKANIDKFIWLIWPNCNWQLESSGSVLNIDFGIANTN